MKQLVLGILAHVDAGKTTLSEAILYNTGEIRNLGRVDNKDTFLDSNEMERARGITIFSKQAEFGVGATHFSLLDTPGHVDFSAEMERTLQVLDYAVLVISAPAGVQGHAATLWRMFRQYDIPVFIFVNKMDQTDNDRAAVLEVLKKELDDACIDFGDNLLQSDDLEEIAVHSGDEQVLEKYLETGTIENNIISEMIRSRRIFPCYFGSALRLDGIDNLLNGLDTFTLASDYRDEFSARIFKITRDVQGNRLTHMKITGGVLSVKDVVSEQDKVNQIRVYSGERYEAVDSIEAGRICAVTGLADSYAGQGLGADKNNNMKLLEPVLTYAMILPDGVNARQVYPRLKTLEEEMPELNLEWNDKAEEILVKLMGQVQLEILKVIINDKFGFEPEFGMGSIVYKETIGAPVIGVGHFEPLRHYAEVHLLMEPGERGTGIVIDSNVSEDVLDKNWQRLILTHIKERIHVGVLTGSAITDIRLTLINGRAHQKHTEGGDFRQATYRAIRQGLMQADNVLLEPFYSFRLEIPSDMIGRAMTDIDSMHGRMDPPEIIGEKAVITGTAPVSLMRDYQINVNAYTRGKGSLTVTFNGYDVCHNQDEVVVGKQYNPDNDVENPASSVFCAHGAGFIVPWYEVFDYMHLSDDESFDADYEMTLKPDIHRAGAFDYTIDLEEIDAIMSRTFESNVRTGKREFKKKKPPAPVYKSTSSVNNYKREKMLIVDGYNVVFAWDELKELATVNIDSAKDRLLHILSNYYGITGIKIMVVFDGYKVKGNHGSETVSGDVIVIHTREGETADRYIEKFTNDNRLKYNITVATSDGLIQQITRGQDCSIVSSRELLEIIESAAKELRDNYNLD